MPIDVDDFAQRLQAECPSGEITIVNHEGSTVVRLYVLTEQNDPWVVANLICGKPTQLEISAYPKSLAVQLILWYRHYLSLKYPLFLVVANDGDQIELTELTSAKDVEDHFPINWVYK